MGGWVFVTGQTQTDIGWRRPLGHAEMAKTTLVIVRREDRGHPMMSLQIKSLDRKDWDQGGERFQVFCN